MIWRVSQYNHCCISGVFTILVTVLIISGGVGKGESMRNIWFGKLKEYWRKTVESVHCKMSRGAAEISRMIPYAHKENWRKRENQHHSQRDHYKRDHRNDKK